MPRNPVGQVRGRRETHTVRMPHVAIKLHRRRRKRVIFGKGERCREDPPFKRGALRSLNQTFPVEHVILVSWPGDDSIWTIVGQVLVFRQKPLLCRRCHSVGFSAALRFGGESLHGLYFPTTRCEDLTKEYVRGSLVGC